jgi:ribosomal protein S18 acetylase RimI-like enzyme
MHKPTEIPPHHRTTLLRIFLYKARKRLFNIDRWVILLHHLDGITSENNSIDSITIMDACNNDALSIIDALPDELVGNMTPDAIKHMVIQRIKSGIPCWLAKKDGAILGGCWVYTSGLNRFVKENIDIDIGKSGELTTLFVVPHARNMGIGKKLCQHVCSSLFSKKWDSAISLVWYSRQASIHAHLKTGFKPVGEKRTYSFLGFRWSRYLSGHHLNVNIESINPGKINA